MGCIFEFHRGMPLKQNHREVVAEFGVQELFDLNIFLEEVVRQLAGAGVVSLWKNQEVPIVYWAFRESQIEIIPLFDNQMPFNLKGTVRLKAYIGVVKAKPALLVRLLMHLPRLHLVINLQSSAP